MLNCPYLESKHASARQPGFSISVKYFDRRGTLPGVRPTACASDSARWSLPPMPMIIHCACGQPMQAPDHAVGKHVRCPKCQAAVPVTAAQPQRPAPPANSTADKVSSAAPKAATPKRAAPKAVAPKPA